MYKFYYYSLLKSNVISLLLKTELWVLRVLTFKALHSQFWNTESPIWNEILQANEMFDYKSSADGLTSTTSIKMNAPIGPKVAKLIMHHNKSIYKTKNKKTVYRNDVQNLMVDFPFGDYFNIIERLTINKF